MKIFRDISGKEQKPLGYRWRNDYILQPFKGAKRKTVFSGYFDLKSAQRDAINLIRENSADSVEIYRFAEVGAMIRPFLVCEYRTDVYENAFQGAAA